MSKLFRKRGRGFFEVQAHSAWCSPGAGIAHHDIDAAEVRHGGLHRRANGIIVGDVTMQLQQAGANRCGGRTGIEGNIQRRNGGAAGRQGLGTGLADADSIATEIQAFAEIAITRNRW